MDYLTQLLQIETNIELFENGIIEEINTIMTENNYVRFYKNQNDWVFVDSDGINHQSSPNIQSSLDQYYQIIDRPDLDIIL
jgi:hypothetical protein